ncbi:flavodoxin [Shewanella sp.]|uniref:flavodoxin n=1 Tax=Shewanella sp. TaxID=50422 RepID=UPI0026236E21|nr:flavodoxin [Shewanella sp.]
MKKVNLVFGTVYGSAQFTAETLEKALIQLGYGAKLWQPDEIAHFTPPQDELLVVVTSTTGQGDLPDDIQPWFYYLKNTAPYLPELKFSVIALGDSSYETFCGAGKSVDELLVELGAKPILERLEIDACETMEPEVEAIKWLERWNQVVKSELAA